MADATNAQTDFRGGEWGTFAQGRFDDREYRRGMNVCFNGYPVEEGAWVRRQGTQYLSGTRLGQAGWLVPFAFAEAAPYVAEFTQGGILRFFSGQNLVMNNDPQLIVSISTANPAIVTTGSALPGTWVTGTQIQFFFTDGKSYPLAGPLMNRTFSITVTGANTFSLQDGITGTNVDGSTFTYTPDTAQAVRILELPTVDGSGNPLYSKSKLPFIRKVQAENIVVILAPNVAPQTITSTANSTTGLFASFTLAPTAFLDGPYLDPATTGTITPSGLSGAINITAPGGTFASTDIGRSIRLFSEPALWASGTAYVTGNIIKFGGLYYTALSNNTGKQPDQNPTIWALNPTGAIWTWATVTGFTDSAHVQITIPASAPNLLYTVPIVTWRLGVYSATTGYPTCGCYHEGRIWLSGAIGNRIDGSVPNGVTAAGINFAPTGPDGTVADNNAISYTFNAQDVNELFWMEPDHQGIVCGSQGGEWLISASQLSDPLTPTSIQAKRVTKYKCANVDPVRAGLGLLFVQAQGRRILEYTADVFSGKFLARNLSEKSRHLTVSGVKQMAYQQDLAPIVWAITNAGALFGMTYKRESSFTSEPPVFAGAHRHQLGSGRIAECVVAGPSQNGNLESAMLITNDPVTNIRHVEMLTDLFDQTSNIYQAWFVDDGVTPTAAVEIGNPPTAVQFFGMNYAVGKTVSVWAAGLDCGDYVVASDGSVTVPLGAVAQSSTVGLGLPLFTDAQLANISATAGPFGNFGVTLNRNITPQVSVTLPSIQQYFAGAPLTPPPDHSHAALDFPNNRVVALVSGTTSAAGFYLFDRYLGTQLQAWTAPSIFAQNPYYGAFSKTIQGPFAIDDLDNVYWMADSFNSGTMWKLNLNTGHVVSVFGGGGFGIPAAALGFTHPLTMAFSKILGYRFLCCTCAAAPDLYILLADKGFIGGTAITNGGHYFTINETVGQCCAGEVIDGGPFAYTAFYTVGGPTVGSASASNLGWYRTVINAPATTFDDSGGNVTKGNGSIITSRIASITPTQIDAAWTHIGTYGVVFDATDSNCIIWCFTDEAVANKQYIVKINSLTGAIVWKIALAGTLFAGTPTSMFSLNQTRINFSRLQWFGGDGSLRTVNTSAGTLLSTTAIPGVNATFSQFSDDTTGSVYSFGGFIQIGGSPTPVNGTPTSFTNSWFRLDGEGVTAQTTATVGEVIPVVIGFNYTSQGQVLRPIAPDASGARNGPAFAKTARDHKAGYFFVNSQQVYIGSQFADQTKLRPAKMKSDKVNINPVNQLYTGVMRQELDDGYSFDTMLGWQIGRPYPACVSAAGAFIHAQDI